MDTEYSLEDEFCIGGYQELDREEVRKEVLENVEDFYTVLEETASSRGEEVSTEYRASERINQRTDVYRSVGEVEEATENEFGKLRAELSTGKGLRAEIVYKKQREWPEEVTDPRLRTMFLKAPFARTTVSLPPELKVEISIPESYTQEEISQVERGMEEFSSKYRDI